MVIPKETFVKIINHLNFVQESEDELNSALATFSYNGFGDFAVPLIDQLLIALSWCFGIDPNINDTLLYWWYETQSPSYRNEDSLNAFKNEIKDVFGSEIDSAIDVGTPDGMYEYMLKLSEHINNEEQTN